MKTIILYSLLLAGAIAAHGQVAVSVKAQVGGGLTKVTYVGNDGMGMCDCGTTIGEQSVTGTTVADLEVNIRRRIIQIGTGIQYLSTARVTNAQYEYYPSGILYTTPATDRNNSHQHVIIPLSLGGRIRASKTLYITPQVSLPLVYLSPDDKGAHHTYSSIRINVEKAINKRLGIVVTPAYSFIATPTTLYTTNYPLNEIASSQLFTLQAGVSYRVL